MKEEEPNLNKSQKNDQTKGWIFLAISIIFFFLSSQSIFFPIVGLMFSLLAIVVFSNKQNKNDDILKGGNQHLFNGVEASADED